MKASERAAEKKTVSRSKASQGPSDDGNAHDDERDQFLPRAKELSSQAFRDGTRVMQDASNFVRTMHQIKQEAEHTVRGGMRKQPYVLLGAAATVGFVLGRGLTLGMSRTLFGLGGKMALSYLAKRVTASIV